MDREPYPLLFAFHGGTTYAQLQNLKLVSYKIVSYNPITHNVTVNVTVRNDTSAYTITNIVGTVFKDQQPFIIGSTYNLEVKKGLSSLAISCKLERCEGVSFFTLLGAIINFNPHDYTADVQVGIVWESGLEEIKQRKNISVKKLL